VTYFFDNCISYRFAGMLAALDVDAVALRHQFSESIRDVALFEGLSGSDVVFVSCDFSQTTKDEELQALRRCGITAIYFGPFFGKLKFWPQAVWLVQRWPKIDGFAGGVAPGTFAEIKQNGRAMPFLP